MIDEFLNSDECEGAVALLRYAHWRPSHLIAREEDGLQRNFVSPRRVSETANQDWFPDELQVLVRGIERRLSTIITFDARHLEYWQATRYPLHGELDHHLDSGYWGSHPAGERQVTFLIYLTTPVAGGSTYFRVLDRDIPAVAGRLLWWHNLFPDGRPNYKALHSGRQLLAGHKVTLITWLRQRQFRLQQGSAESCR